MGEQLDPRVRELTLHYFMEVQVMHLRLSKIRAETAAMGRTEGPPNSDPIIIALNGVALLAKSLREVLGVPESKILRGAQGLDGKPEIVQ